MLSDLSIILSLLLLVIYVPLVIGQYPTLLPFVQSPLPQPQPQPYGPAPSFPVQPPIVPERPYLPPVSGPGPGYGGPAATPPPQPYVPTPVTAAPPQPTPQLYISTPRPILPPPAPPQSYVPQPLPVLPPPAPSGGGYGVGVGTPRPFVPPTQAPYFTTPFLPQTTQPIIINTFPTTPLQPRTTYFPLPLGTTTTPFYWWVTTASGQCCPQPRPCCQQPVQGPVPCCSRKTLSEKAEKAEKTEKIEKVDAAKNYQPSGCAWDFLQHRCRDITNQCDGICKNLGNSFIGDCRCATNLEGYRQISDN